MARLRAVCCTFSFISILLQSSIVVAQEAGKMSVGQSLTAATTGGSSWLSPSGDFAFGFHQLTNNSDLFLLAIWYAKIPDTIVWYADDGDPFVTGSTVTLTAQGLVVTDPQGIKKWDAPESNTPSDISYGFMNDNGNFILKSSSSDGPVWESFWHPTDTLLPTQIMERGKMLNSRRSETNFTRGRFQLSFQSDGSLVLNTRELDTNFVYAPYYAIGTYGNNQTSAGYQVVYNESGYMYILGDDGSQTNLLSNPASASEYYQRATMDLNGMLTWYYHPRASIGSGWKMISVLPGDNICRIIPDPDHLGSGVCGYNSICSLNNDGRPRCQCPENYSLLDPSDAYGSCKPDFILYHCDGYGQTSMKDEYKLVPLPNTNWPFGDYAKSVSSTEEDCKNSCLDDCFCAAVIFNGSTCWKKKLPLSHGRSNSTVLVTSWLKVGNYSTESLNPSALGPLKPSLPTLKQRTKQNMVLAMLLGGSAFANLLSIVGFGVLFSCRRKRLWHLEGDQRKTLREYSNVARFSYQELKEATNEFKEEIGRGAFGVVYKGIIGTRGPPIFVAVKKLDRISNSTNKEFETEVNVIGQTHHKNLVRLIGFCKEEDQRLLVYEYMSNGTLADHLFGDLKPSWRARIQVIQGVASGLLYLHEECSTQIIHCDIKPQNILIDNYHNACISDFGLAKLLVIDQSHTNTAIRGTKGYVAPEWFRNKPVTVKVDVYSFGVLLLEIICCRKSICLNTNAEERAILTDWAFDCYQSRRLDSLVNDDEEALNDWPKLERFIMVALWCIQENPHLRPTMRMVIQMLEGLVEVPHPPSPASFSVITQ